MNITKKVSLPDMPSVSTPDVGGLADDLVDFAGTAADAISSAAGHVPGLDDYRAAARRRRMFSIAGVLALALLVAVIVKRRRQDDSAESAR